MIVRIPNIAFYKLLDNRIKWTLKCAKTYGANYIVTRNVSDYVTSDVNAISPEDYM